MDIRILRGPNYWSINHKVIVARLDIGKYEDIPTDKIEGFTGRLQMILPGLYDHHCSEGKSGGFIERMISGTWMGHVIEHIALELQTLSGMPCYFGKTRGTGKRGIYNVIVSFEEERAGLYAFNAAIELVLALAEGRSYPVNNAIEELCRISANDNPGPSTRAIIKAAIARGIPHIRLNGSTLVQLGYGKKLKRIEATITENTSSIAVDLASDKQKTKSLLNAFSIPVPRGRIVHEISELDDVINEIGFPLVTKPYNANQGKGVSLNLADFNEAVRGFEKAKNFSDEVIIEEFIPGDDFRLLVINHKLVAAARRTPAMVIGNSYSTVRELVKLTNQSPDRGNDHENILTKIPLDPLTEEILKKQDVTLDTIPSIGQKVLLRNIPNLSQGGTAEDVTRLVHPQIAEIAERASRIIGLDICGIDLVAEDISLSVSKSKVAIIEVNAAPGLRMHTNPAIGYSRPVGEAIIEMLFRNPNDGRIPIVAITGTNGKTTTARILAHIAKTAGYTVGFNTTEGIYINNVLIEEGDCTGAASAQKILRDTSVNFAVLECARGGILKQGLGFDACDTAIVTNVAEDHLGLEGIETIDDMAQVKAVVPESVRVDGLAILNENNEHAFQMKKMLKCAVALFSINGKSTRIVEHIQRGGMAAYFNDNIITLINGNKTILSEHVSGIPLTFGGHAPFMIENVLAAILAAYFNRIDVKYISDGLHSFVPSYETTPGRLNVIDFRNFKFILDYAHNMHGIEALGSYIIQLTASQKIGIITAPGDRRESDIIGIGKSAAEIFDKIIIRIDEDTRDRKPVEIADLLRAGIRLARNKCTVEIVEKETDAIMYACSIAPHHSLIVLLCENIRKSHAFVSELKDNEDKTYVEHFFEPETPYVLQLGKNNVYKYAKRKAVNFRGNEAKNQ